MNVMAARVRATITLLAVLLTLNAVAGCVSAREKAINAAAVTINAAAKGFVQIDHDKQMAIVAKATSEADGKTALTTYREKRAKVVESITLTFHALISAVVLKDDPTSLPNLLAAAAQLKADIADLKNTP